MGHKSDLKSLQNFFSMHTLVLECTYELLVISQSLFKTTYPLEII